MSSLWFPIVVGLARVQGLPQPWVIDKGHVKCVMASGAH
jgi:hypothetical protein